MIEPDINERMARFAPSQNVGNQPDPVALEVLAETEADAPPPMAPGFDPIAVQIARESQEEMMATLRGASAVNPDQAARAQRIGQQVGIGQDVVLRNMAEMEREVVARQAIDRDLMRTAPNLARFLGQREFATIAHDDIDNLTKAERVFKWFAGIPKDVEEGLSRAVATSELGKMYEAQMRGVEPTWLDRVVIQSYNDELGRLSKESGFIESAANIVGIQAEMAAQVPESVMLGATMGGGWGMVGGPLAPATVPAGMAFGAGVGLTVGMAKAAYVLEAGNAYGSMVEEADAVLRQRRDAGEIDAATYESDMREVRDRARNIATGVGVVNAGLELVGLKFITAAGREALKTAVRRATAQAVTQQTTRAALGRAGMQYGLAIAGETGTEVMQEIVTVAGEELNNYGADLPLKMSTDEGVAEVAQRLVDTAIDTAKGMTLVGLPGPVVNYYVNTRKVAEARKAERFFTDLADVSKQDKVAERSPAAYERFLAAQAEGTQAETIYVDARTMQSVLQQARRADPALTDEVIDEAMPGVRQQLDQQVETGGDVTIPTATFGARLARTDLGRSLIPHMRLNPDALSVDEAVRYRGQMEERRQEAMRLMQEQDAAGTSFSQEAETVRDSIRTQIEAAGRSREEADIGSLLYRDFVVIQAARQGITPAEFQAQRGLRGVEGAMPAVADPLEQADQFDQAGQRRTDSPEFKTWSNDASVIANEQSEAHEFTTGTPVVVEALHGSTERGLRRFDVGRAVEVPGAIFFTSNPAVAEQYTYERAYGQIISEQPTGDVIRAYVAFANPMVYQPKGKVVDAIEMWRAIEQAKAAGHDGLIIKNIDDSIGMTGDMGDVYVTWNPTSIKSVDNRGTWSRTTANIMEQAATMDAEYMAAVERGDMATAQRMVDAAAKETGAIVAYYGSPSSFKPEVRDGKPVFLADNIGTSLGYTRGAGLKNVQKAYLRFRNPFVIDASGRPWYEIPVSDNDAARLGFSEKQIELLRGVISTETIAQALTKGGFDGAIIKNVVDDIESGAKPSTTYVVTKNESFVSSDPVTYDEAGNIVPLSRRFDITSPRIFEQAAMSTRVPTAVKPIEDALNDVLLADFPSFLRDEKFVSKNLAKFKELNAPIRIDPNATEQQQLDQIISHMTSNLLWLHDAMEPAIRERARMWYVGGRRLVDWLAERHGMSPMGAATVFAVLSPQKNWYENVGLGIRIIDIVATQGSATMDAEMQDAYLNSLRKEQTKSEGKLSKHDAAKPDRGKKEIEAWETKRAELAKEAKAASDKVAEAQGNIDAIGKRTLADLLRDREFFLAAIMVRWFDQTKNNRTYPVISPEGGVGSPMLTEAGTPASIRYGSYNEVSKAIAAYVDGRAENVHYLIGGEHKVRNFYNNLFNPEDPRFATIDTHAIAAAYLMPLAGTDKLVQHGLGGGVGNAMFGMGGGYAVFYEAYRRAAEARGIQPREMQSITWEAIRGMFEAAMKGGLKAPVAATWKRYVDGEIDIDAARADVMQRAGGITTPTWVSLPMDMKPAAGYEGVSRTAADAQAGRIAAKPTAASVMFEVAPDPADAALVQRWEALSPQQRQAISVRVAEDIIPRILREYGVAADMVMQVGGWEGATNVGFALRMPPGPLVRQIAQAVGYALSQQAVFTLSATQFQGSTKSDIIVLQLQPGTTVEQIGDLYERKLYPLGIQGHATVQDSMIISLDPGVDGAILADTIAAAVAGDGRIVEITHATGWRSLDETRITDEAARAADEGRRAEGAAGRRRVDAYRREATRLVAEYLEQPGILEQAARGEARGGFDPKRLTVLLNKQADLSTFLHELSHYFLTTYSDIAASGNASPELLADLDTTLQWFGIAGDTPQARLAAWNSMSLDQQRPFHEQFAYSFEVYAFDGKAPSAELRGVFERFSSYLKRVYKSIRDELNAIYRREFGKDLPILTGEVRQVMDRMLASDAAIRRQQAVESIKPAFLTREQAGVDEAQWAEHQAALADAEAIAINDMTKASLRTVQWMSNARSRIVKEMQSKHDAKRKEVREEVAAQVRMEPAYRAQAYLRYGKFIDADGQEVEVDGPHKLDLDTVKQMYELEPDALRPDVTAMARGKYGFVGKDGLNPDMIAETFGYSSGDQMIRAVMGLKPIKEAIDERTDAVMVERFSDLNSKAAVDAEVQKALHNEARARFVAIELKFAAKATEPTRVIVEAARQAARDIIAAKKVRDVRPSEHVAAEARAAREAVTAGQFPDPSATAQAASTRAYNEAIAAGKTETEAGEEAMQAGLRAAEAARARIKEFESRYPGATREQIIIRAKRQEMYQNQLAAEALRVKDEVDKDVKYLRRVLRDENVKRMGADATDQVAELLSRFDVAAVPLKILDRRKQTLAAWMEAKADGGIVPDIAPELLEAGRRVNYREMTVAEFRDLVSAVKQIEYVGKNERKLQLAEEKAEFEEKRDEIVTRIRATGRLRGLDIDPRSPLTNIGRTVSKLQAFAASHLKAASIARVLDGGKDDGPLWNTVIRTANDAADMETRMRSEATAKLAEILKPVFALGNMGGKGMFFRSINRSLNREARIAIALNMGNAGNMQRLLDGEGWNMAQVQPILESLTAAEWNAVQQVWDFLETYRPLVAAKERRLYGKEPNWVEPQPLTVRTSDGQTLTLRGGYYPVKYDPVASDRVATFDEVQEAKDALRGTYTAATTRRSFTKARAEKVVGRPILYTLDAAFSGVNDVIHDLAWHEWLISTNRLLRDEKFANAVRETRGPEFLRQLREWAKANAAGDRSANVEGVLSWLRQGISASGLGFNVMSAALQITGFNQSVVRVGAKWVGLGIAEFTASPFATSQFVREKSSFMAERQRTQFRELNELRNTVRGKGAGVRKVLAQAYVAMMTMQRAVDTPTWVGAYRKALAAGKDDATAVALADQSVKDSQGSGLTADLAAIERGGPGLKLFTVFYSYMNTVYNMAAVQTYTSRGRGKLAADYVMLMVVPVVLGHAIKALLTPDAGDDDFDPEALARKLAAEELSFLMGTMVVAREFGGAAQLLTGAEGARMGYGGPAGVRAIGEAYNLATQTGQMEFDRAWFRSAINTLGAFTGLPSAQINRTIDGVEAILEGEVKGVGAVVAPLTGVKK